MAEYPFVRWPGENAPIDWARLHTSSKLHIYGSYPMTGLPDPETHYREVDRLFGVPSAYGHSVYCPHLWTSPSQHGDLTPEEIYRIDKAQAERADLLIAFCNRPAYGVGIEAMFALNKGLAVVLVYPASSPPSRLLRGLPNVIEAVGRDMDEMIEAVHIVLSSISAKAVA